MMNNAQNIENNLQQVEEQVDTTAPDLEEEEEEDISSFELDHLWPRRLRKKLKNKNRGAINQFLGETKRTIVSGIVPR